MKCKKIQIPVLVIIFLIAAIVFLSVFLCYLFKSQKMGKILDMKSSYHGYSFINPLLDCADVQIDSMHYGNLVEEIKDSVNKNIKSGKVSQASIYFRDLSNGPWFGYNEKENFSPASLMKVPILIAYLKMSESDSGLLEKKINSGAFDYSLEQNILPDKRLQENTEYQIKDVLEYMIKYSDNFATFVLLDNIDPVALDNIYKDLSLKIPSWEGAENYMTVRDYSAFFRILYNASYLNRENSELALKMLSYSVFENGLVAGLPKGTVISHKFGERVLTDSKQLHDCGIIYNEKGDYLLCVMTRGRDFAEMESFLQEISALIYNNFYK